MRKENGFSAIEALVIILILSAVGVAGFFVYKNVNDKDDKKTSTSQKANSTKTAQTTDVYAGWKTYSDDKMSFKYPSTWTAQKWEDGVGGVMLTGPSDNDIRLVDAANGSVSSAYVEKHLSAFIQNVHNDGDNIRRCMSAGIDNNTCKVHDLSDITVSGVPTKVVLSEFDGLTGYPNYVALTDDSSVKEGSNTYQAGFKLGQKVANMTAMVQYKENTTATGFMSDGWLESAASFKATQSYKDLVNIFKSVSYK